MPGKGLNSKHFAAHFRSVNFIHSLLWRPAGFVPSLEALEPKHGLLSKWDVTSAVRGPNHSGDPLTVVELAGGKVVGDLRLALTADDMAVGGVQGLFNCAEPLDHYLMHRRRFRLPKYRRGTALLLGAANGDNYFHWMLQSVPRWKILQAAGRGDYDYVLLQAGPWRFQDEALDRLSVPPARRLRCSKNFVHQFERLVVPAMPFPGQNVSPWACEWTRSLFPPKAAGPEKVYLALGGGRRRLANQSELQEALSARGFVSVQPGQLTVAQQVEAVGSARWMVAPHGAALTNLIFAPPGAALLELFHPQHKNRCYENLASICGHRYESIVGRAINPDASRQLEYAVDVSALLQAVDRMLNS